jgi:5-methylcytosine-specific restriction endonuclease McrA
MEETAQKQRLKEREWRTLCRHVDERDNGCCRVCGRRTLVTLNRVPERREHHHILPRSRGGTDTKANVIVLCAKCHDERHVTRTLDLEGTSGRLKIGRRT